ncbi:hypothetical protein [Muricoccus aerilatus]|uniref:hypothetical protein n=1 Tax=Muricoccus aerilatus TaxID=452982 RepID=UPI0005C225BE|nr:hypothetical protein [Roseomonas aerilata]
MSAALAAEPSARSRKPRPIPERRIVNKRDLCHEVGISRTTLDTRLTNDPAFPVLSRGNGNGDSWQFDLDEARAHLSKPWREPSFQQQLAARKVLAEDRRLAEEARLLVRREELDTVLRRALLALGRAQRAMPAELAVEAGLTAEQQRILRAGIERSQRAFVEDLRQSGLGDADE